ncbi:Exo_endo_phos domain-containing protein [Gossypium australe]|uniref:Exo_endo_phos domain-containing protein n=1 Tax=Gossypium australe TaxID=47621 RepID=A0A5B6V6P7_9ROSI|nr:Exo_endo_phos domain-containing protein [Gossypium australe]
MHAIGSTFGGILRSEINDDVCRFRVNLDVQKPLRRGIFVSSENNIKSWIPFKFEKLPIFCFGCGRLDHGINDCLLINPAEKEKVREDPPYTIALKAEPKVVGRESLKFNSFAKKLSLQRTYTENSIEQNGQEEDVVSIVAKEVHLEDDISNESNRSSKVRKCWSQKERFSRGDWQENTDETREDGAKRLKNGDLSTSAVEGAEIMCVDGNQNFATNYLRSAEEWRFTGLYGSPYLRDQNLVWNLLRKLSQVGNYPWLVAGDFNEIMYSFEKKRGLPRDQKRMEVFRDTLEECNLMDIGYSEVWYTWERGNLPETNI